MVFPVFTSESLMKVPGKVELLKPVIVPEVFVAVQVKSAPETFEVRFIFVLVLEQIGDFGPVVNNGTG